MSHDAFDHEGGFVDAVFLGKSSHGVWQVYDYWQNQTINYRSPGLALQIATP